MEANKKMWYYIGYLADGEVQKYYETLTSELSRKFGIENLSLTVPAHLKLKYPFELGDTSEIEKKIDDLAFGKNPVPFTIYDFNRFDNNKGTVFLSVKPNEELSTFVKDCITELGDLNEVRKFDPNNYHLHLSVARHLRPETSDLICNYLSTMPKPRFEALFDNLTLFVGEHYTWKVKKIFKLKNLY